MKVLKQFQPKPFLLGEDKYAMLKEGSLDLILLVDDNRFSNFLNKNIISELGIAKTIQILEDGAMALDYIKYSKSKGKMPDLILLDIVMPTVDGTDLMKTLSKMKIIENSTTKIVALTAGVTDNKYYEIESLGFDEILFKPLDKIKLLQMINKLFDFDIGQKGGGVVSKVIDNW